MPATATAIVIPTRTTFDDPGQPPILVSITIDDRPADEFVLRDDEWRQHELLLPPPGPRRLRRIDVRADRLRHGLRGVQVGESGWCSEGTGSARLGVQEPLTAGRRGR